MGLGAVYLGVFQAATRALSSNTFERRSMTVPSKASISSDLVNNGRCGKDGLAGAAASSTVGHIASDNSEHAQSKAALLAALLTSFVMAMLTGMLRFSLYREVDPSLFFASHKLLKCLMDQTQSTTFLI